MHYLSRISGKLGGARYKLYPRAKMMALKKDGFRYRVVPGLVQDLRGNNLGAEDRHKLRIILNLCACNLKDNSHLITVIHEAKNQTLSSIREDGRGNQPPARSYLEIG
jgi:hypothetical protein